MTVSEVMRFIPKVKMDTKRPGDCWEWTAQIGKNGYGRFRVNPKPATMGKSHRIAYEHWRGPINGQIDHLCRNRSCVNPWHLEDVSLEENLRRGFGTCSRLERKSCPKGHWFDEVNTYNHPSGTKICRICKKEWQRVWRERKEKGLSRTYVWEGKDMEKWETLTSP